MIEDQAIKHCREILKKNNLHPLKKLGKGAFSFVFSVEKIELKSTENQIYSVKCIQKKQFSKKPYLNKYIEQEIQILRNLNHENIVKLHRTFEDEGWIFILMEFCDKGNIQTAQNLRQNGVFQFQQFLHIIKNILEGLDYMHQKKLIHRDIKAENVLLMSNPSKKSSFSYVTKICDLGFCRQDDDNVTTFCGTTSYMAPEIFGKEIYDYKVDIWAIGVLMFKMLFGDFPFKGLNVQYEITAKCSKGFNLKRIKYKPNSSVSKENFQIINEVFAKIFVIEAEKRATLKDLRKYAIFEADKTQIKPSLGLISTDSDSSEDDGSFEIQKFYFIEDIVKQVKSLKFLTPWEETCFQFYLNKISLNILVQFSETDDQIKKYINQLKHQNQSNSNFIASNMTKCNTIHKLQDHFTQKANKFSEIKEAYRLVVGNAFSKAHKSISENISLRSQIKIKLFCCHLINRIFEKEHRNQIFSSYFQWLKALKKGDKFEFKSFKQWILNQNPEKLVQTVEAMNEKFYKKK